MVDTATPAKHICWEEHVSLNGVRFVFYALIQEGYDIVKRGRLSILHLHD